MGWMLSTSGSYTPGFLMLDGMALISLLCCVVLARQKY